MQNRGEATLCRTAFDRRVPAAAACSQHRASGGSVARRDSRQQAGRVAGPAAEDAEVRMPTVATLDDQRAVGVPRLVHASGRHHHICQPIVHTHGLVISLHTQHMFRAGDGEASVHVQTSPLRGTSEVNVVNSLVQWLGRAYQSK